MIIDSPIISGSYLSTGSLSQTGNVSITGSLTVTAGISGSFSGSGANLFGIPASGITGLNLSQISSGSVSASISPNQGLLINTSVSASNFTGSFTGSLTGIATSASYASFALTSSYSLGGSGFPFSGSAVITGSLLVSGSAEITGSLSVSGSISASLFGTASQATSASYALTASYLLGYISPFPFTGSAAITGSLIVTGSVAISTLVTSSGVRYVIADQNGLLSAQTASAAIFTTQQVVSTSNQTTFPITNGYATGYVTVFVNGTKLSADEYVDTSGTNIIFLTGSALNDVVEFQKYLPASGVSNNTLRTVNYFTTTLGQTVFTVNYTPGLLDVFYNGSKLNSTEYTAANGTSITLATGSNLNDSLEVDVYSYQVGAFSGIGGVGVAKELAFYNTTNSITGSNKVTYDGSTFSITGSFLVTGSSTFTNIGPAIFSGSVTSTAGFSGSFSGNADSASLAQNSLLLQGTGSIGFATTASLLAVSSSQQQISASLLNVVANYATTGSNSFRADQSITGSLVVSSTITAQTLVVQTVTSSIVYSSGSNNFGNQLSNNQTFTGSVNITGSLALAGNITSNGTAVVLGSGTSNYLPKFTAASTIGNSLVVDNGTNIGIGTTNPTAGRLQINVSDTTTAAHFQIVDGTTTLADSFVTNFRNANDGDGRYSLSRWQVQNAVGNDQIGFIGVQSITGAGAYTPNIVFGQRTGVSTYATRMTLDSSGNLGLGVTPSAWSLGKGFDINGGMGLLSVSNASFVLNNAYYNGGWIYKASSFAQNFVLNNDGSFQFNIAPSGSANAAITFTQAMTLTTAGELLINTTSDAGDWKLQVNGSAYFTNTNSVGYTYVTIGNSGASGRSYDIGVGGNGVGSPYQNSFYVFDNVANQPRFYINSTGAATFRGDFTVFSSATGATTGDLLVDTSAKYVYVGRLSGVSGDNTTFQVRDRTGTARATIPGGGSIDTVFSTNSSNFIVTNYSATALMTIANSGAATFSSTITATGATIASDVVGDPVYLRVRNNNTGGYPSSLALSIYGYSGTAAYFDALRIQASYPGYGSANFYVKYQSTSADVNAISIRGDGFITFNSTSDAISINHSVANKRSIAIHKTSGDVDDYYIVCDNIVANKFLVTGGGTIYAVNTTVQSASDIRFKENIRDLETGLSEILSLKPRRFDWKEGKGMDIKNAIGFVAQEVEEILPDLVKDDWINSSTDSTSYKSLGMTNMIPTLVKAIQEQNVLIQELQEKLQRNNIN